MDNKLGQTPAFPEMHDNTDINKYVQPGISKRFYATCAAMQGLLANSTNSNRELRYDHMEEFIKNCYAFADELLKQENL